MAKKDEKSDHELLIEELYAVRKHLKKYSADESDAELIKLMSKCIKFLRNL